MTGGGAVNLFWWTPKREFFLLISISANTWFISVSNTSRRSVISSDGPLSAHERALKNAQEFLTEREWSASAKLCFKSGALLPSNSVLKVLIKSSILDTPASTWIDVFTFSLKFCAMKKLSIFFFNFKRMSVCSERKFQHSERERKKIQWAERWNHVWAERKNSWETHRW